MDKDEGLGIWNKNRGNYDGCSWPTNPKLQHEPNQGQEYKTGDAGSIKYLKKLFDIINNNLLIFKQKFN